MASDAVFLVFWVIIAVFAVLAVFLQKPVYNALCMAISIFSMAGMYIFLGYEFMAALQVLVYVGAISVAIIFVIMLSPPVTIQPKKLNLFKVAVGIATAAMFFTIFVVSLYWKFSNLQLSLDKPAAGVKEVGLLLATKYAVPFELISVILLVSILGAIMLARKEE